MVGTRVRYLFRDDRASSLSETMKIGAFADKKKKHFDEPQLDLPFCTFFADKISLNEHNPDDEPNNLQADRLGNGTDVQVNGGVENGRRSSSSEERNGNVASDGITMVSTNDDFIMKTPFAKPSGEKFELDKFFRECQQAPLLETFKDLPPLEGQDLQKQLDTFESDLNEFDSIVQTLCQTSPNNN